MVGTVMNLTVGSGWPRLVSLLLVIFGITTAAVGPFRILWPPIQEYLDVSTELLMAIVGERPGLDEDRTGQREALLARLNRAAAEYKDLVDAISKLLIPLVVALVALAGVLWTLAARD